MSRISAGCGSEEGESARSAHARTGIARAGADASATRFEHGWRAYGSSARAHADEDAAARADADAMRHAVDRRDDGNDSVVWRRESDRAAGAAGRR